MPTSNSLEQPITDFITGEKLPNIGAEENRQKVERFLVEKCGVAKDAISVNVPLNVKVNEEKYHGRVDLTVSAKGRLVMVIKCVAGSPGSWLREIVAAARLLEETPIPWAVVSDGKKAVVMDLINGQTGEGGLGEIVTIEKVALMAEQQPLPKLTQAQRKKESILFRSYNMDQVNVAR